MAPTSGQGDPQAFAEAVREFATAVAADERIPMKPEDRLYRPVEGLLAACGDLWNASVDTHQQATVEGVGWPDIGVNVDSLLCGHIELKAPGATARPEHFTGQNREQWKRYQALPNLIYTNGTDWSLYHSGKRSQRVRITTETSAGENVLNPDSFPRLGRLLCEFLKWKPTTPSSARGLAEFLAPFARFLRDEVKDALARESPSLKQLATDWRGILFSEADDDQFADAFAQTLTYALLLARFEGAESIRREFAVATLRDNRHGLLASALDLFQTARGEMEMSFRLLERVIEAVDAPELLHNPQMTLLPEAHDAQPVDTEPWLQFYERFLGAYDPKLQKNSGIYFTPVEVVRAQVRFANDLVRERFAKPLGLADAEVSILDPACGTGTYLLAVIERVRETFGDRYEEALLAGKLRELAGRLYGFEILVGPYAVARLRLTQQLHTGDDADSAPRLFLADTLESPNLERQQQSFGTSLVESMTDERRRAGEVKQDTRILVCLGNPPYDLQKLEQDDGETKRKGGWVRNGDKGNGEDAILEDFLKPVHDAGGGVHLKSLYNDYVYFWRWALWKVFDSAGDGGIVSFITASSYLSGPGFAGMRQKMREVFDDLWIIDLGGDSLGTRTSENVFNITIPVAIAIGVRGGIPTPKTPARVWRTRIEGSKEAKLERLAGVGSRQDLPWRECLTDWGAPFYPAGAGSYFHWPEVVDVFPWQHSGSQFKRTWPIGETRGVLEARWRDLLARPREGRRTAFRETRDRRIEKSYQALFGGPRETPIADLAADAPSPPIRRYAYRSFDRQWAFAAITVADFGRPPLWRAHGDQQVYLTSLLTIVPGEGPGAVAAAEVPDLSHFRGSFGAKHTIPLWRDADATEPNVTGGLLERIGREHGSTPPQNVCSHMRTASSLSRRTSSASGTSSSSRRRACRSRRTRRCSGASPTSASGCSTCTPTASGSQAPTMTVSSPRARRTVRRPCR